MDVRQPSTRFLVGSELLLPAGNETIEARDPARDRHLADVPVATRRDVDAAVAAARAAFDDGWCRSDPADRAAVLRTVADCLREHAEELTASNSSREAGRRLRRLTL